jgi:hypothetical protein
MTPPSREATVPLAGPYTIRFVKRGPAVPARFILVSDVDPGADQGDRVWAVSVDETRQPGQYTGHQLEAIYLANWLNGRLSGAIEPAEAKIFIRLMAHGDIITEEKYAKMMRNRDHWREIAPWHPCLHHNDPIDLRKLSGLGRLTPPPGDDADA